MAGSALAQECDIWAQQVAWVQRRRTQGLAMVIREAPHEVGHGAGKDTEHDKYYAPAKYRGQDPTEATAGGLAQNQSAQITRDDRLAYFIGKMVGDKRHRQRDDCGGRDAGHEP